MFPKAVGAAEDGTASPYFVKSHVKDLNSVHLCSGPINKYLLLNIIFQIKCSEGADERSRCFSTEVLPLNQSNMFFPAPDSQSGEKFPSILQLCVLQEGLGPQFEGPLVYALCLVLSETPPMMSGP